MSVYIKEKLALTKEGKRIQSSWWLRSTCDGWNHSQSSVDWNGLVDRDTIYLDDISCSVSFKI